jgi:hypothetical protein
MLRAVSAPVLVLLGLVSQAAPAPAQATVRPIPRVARSWESAAVPALAPRGSGKTLPASVERDLDFIGPLPLERAVDSSEADAAQEERETVELELFAGAIGSGNFEGQQGSLTTQRGGWQVALGTRRTRGLSQAFELGTEASFYDFGAGSPVPGVNKPFNDVYDTRLAGRFLYSGEGRLDVYGGLQLGNAGENAVGVDDSLYLGGAVALRYEAAPDFALLVGIAGMSRFDDSPWILPYIGFDWQVSERLRLSTEAAEIHADYRLTQDWSIGLSSVYDLRQFRLNEDGPLHGGSFRDEEIRAGGSLAWRVAKGVELELELGKILWRETTFHDGQTGFLGETELSSPWYAGLGLKVGF